MTTKTEQSTELMISLIRNDGSVNIKEFANHFSAADISIKAKLTIISENLNIPLETLRAWFYSVDGEKYKPNHYTNFILKFISLYPETYNTFAQMKEFDCSESLQMDASQYTLCRATLGLTQVKFAELTNSPIDTVKACGRGRRLPSPLASKLIWLLAHDEDFYGIYVKYLETQLPDDVKKARAEKEAKLAEKEAKKAEKEAKKAEKEAKLAAKLAEKEAKAHAGQGK